MQTLIEMLFLFFLGMGFVIEGSSIYNLGSFFDCPVKELIEEAEK